MLIATAIAIVALVLVWVVMVELRWGRAERRSTNKRSGRCDALPHAARGGERIARPRVPTT